MSLAFRSPRWSREPRRWQVEALEACARHYAQPGAEPAVISAIMGSGKSQLIEEICASVELAKDECVVVSTSTELLVEDLHSAIHRRCGHARTSGTWYGKGKRLGQVTVCCTPSADKLAQKLNTAKRKVALWIADECHRSECDTVLTAHKNLSPAHALGLTATPFRSDQFEALTLFKSMLYRYGVTQAQADGVVVPWRLEHWQTGDALDASCAERLRDAEGPGLANASDIADAEQFAERLSLDGLPTKAVHSRLGTGERRKILAELQRGTLRCVVHVNLLTEGANYPWLRWLLLRRQVESRVRFIQEIGRLLRSHEGKQEAVFYDPHDLFGTFKLTYAEALGDPPERQAVESDAVQPEERAESIRDADPPLAMTLIESTIRALIVACDAVGIIGNRRAIPKAYRVKPITPIQLAALAGAVERADACTPANWKPLLNQIVERAEREPDVLRFGFAADLLTALESIRDAGEWPPVNERGRISAAVGDPMYRLRQEKTGQLAVEFGKVTA